jgi:hypothetical protein
MGPGAIVVFPEPGKLGDCPVCGRNDGFLNVYKTHWFICKRHKLKWYAGYDLFPGWRNETSVDWQRNEALLAGYREVRAKYRTLLANQERKPRRPRSPDGC